MSPHSGDTWIDDELRNVALPADLLSKLRGIAELDDAELDRALRDVPVPSGLGDRLRSIGSLDEVDLDDELRHVPLPASLADRLRRIPAVVRRTTFNKDLVRYLAIAASLLIAIGVGYLAAISPAFFGKPRQPAGPASAIAVKAPGSQQPRRGERPSKQRATKKENEDRTGLVRTVPPLPTDGGGIPSEPVVADSSPPPPFIPAPSDAAQSIAQAASSDPSPAEGVLGSNVAVDHLPPLASMPAPLWRGITPPRERGYDLMFQLKHGVHPFASPAASPVLAVSQVPLVTSTASFDAALELVAKRKLPPPDKIRTEEFLAAMDYGFPLPESGAIGIRSALGPSPWGTPGLSLLQVAAQATSLPRGANGSSHVAVILDASATMYWEDRWQTALDGLREYIARMSPTDRLSFVLMSEKAKIIAERQSPAEALDALASLPDRPTAKAVNVVDALEMAGEALGRGAPPLAGRIVLLTDGLLQLSEPVNQRFESVVQAAVKRGHRFEVLDLRQDETIDAELNRLAAAAADKAGSSGVVSRAGTADDIRWRLLEIADGQSHLVAANATMKVTFKPDAVVLYRLLGHEATSVAGLIDATVEADLRAGEAATGLFELVLKPDGGETIATVEVTWRDPKTGASQSTSQTVSRLQLASSFYQAPLSLQLAALAAETAEILRNSYFAPAHSHSLAGLAELGAQLNSRLRGRPSFAKLMTLVEQAQRSVVVPQ